MPHESGLTCIHEDDGLCPTCEAEYEADPLSWLEYGQHPAGLENWQRLQDELAADRPPEHNDDMPEPFDDSEIPF